VTHRSSGTLALVDEGRARLEEHGVPNALHNAEWMLSHLLGCRRSDLYLDPRRDISPAIVARYREFVARRSVREPLQYILGSTEFMSATFLIDHGVFIPRFETEVLVERVERRLHERAADRTAAVLDLCCGTGVIALALLLRNPHLTAVGVDISPEAVRAARRNADLHGLAGRVEFVTGDAAAYVARETARFEAIVCNPPYIAASEVLELAPEVREFEPMESLLGGPEGLDFYRTLVPRVPERLAGNGVAAFEIGAGQGEAVRRLFLDASLADVQVHQDYNHMDRVVIGRAGPSV
jgi:release factor glutamine methyltransferase